MCEEKIKQWDLMTDEDLACEFQNTREDELFNYFVNRNKKKLWAYARSVKIYFNTPKAHMEQLFLIACFEAMVNFNPQKKARFFTYFWFRMKKYIELEHRATFMIKPPPRLEFKEEGRSDICSLDKPENSYHLWSPKDDMTSEMDRIASEDCVGKALVKIEEVLTTKQFNLLMLHVGLTKSGKTIEPKSLMEIARLWGCKRQNLSEMLSTITKRINKKIGQEDFRKLLESE